MKYPHPVPIKMIGWAVVPNQSPKSSIHLWSPGPAIGGSIGTQIWAPTQIGHILSQTIVNPYICLHSQCKVGLAPPIFGHFVSPDPPSHSARTPVILQRLWGVSPYAPTTDVFWFWGNGAESHPVILQVSTTTTKPCSNINKNHNMFIP